MQHGLVLALWFHYNHCHFLMQRYKKNPVLQVNRQLFLRLYTIRRHCNYSTQLHGNQRSLSGLSAPPYRWAPLSVFHGMAAQSTISGKVVNRSQQTRPTFSVWIGKCLIIKPKGSRPYSEKDTKKRQMRQKRQTTNDKKPFSEFRILGVSFIILYIYYNIYII